MGDTAAPPQAAPGLLGGGGGGGSSAAPAPRVHSAIVERLRARIAICRQHHLSCEGRYERGRAENSERERESTLQLLHLVQHGQAARKGCKHGKAAANGGSAAPPPAECYPLHSGSSSSSNGPAATGGRHGVNGEAPASGGGGGGEQRNPALLALQGSLKRKLVVNLSPANNKRSNGIADSSFLDIKRLRVGDRDHSMGRGHCGNSCPNQSVLGSLSVGQGPQRKVSSPANNTHSNTNGMFNMALKEVKKEPGETFSCSQHLDDQVSQGQPFPNRYGEDAGEQLMDPELQELFNELTNISVPPMSDLELENMINATIKQDEPFNIDLGQQIQRPPPTRSSSLQVDKMVIKQEYSPALNQTSIGSPQMRPSSTGPVFTVSTGAMSTLSPIPSAPQTPPSQGSSVTTRPLANWQEVSHAQQLKQIAANRQQHALMQCQQSQSPSSWPALSPAETSAGSFAQEKISSPSSFQQQQFSPQSSTMSGVPLSGNQSKGMNNYIYRSSALSQGTSINAIMQQRKPQDLSRGYISNSQLPLEESQNNIKPLFHFNSEQTTQQMPSILSGQNKPSLLHYAQQQQQPPNSVAVQQQTPQQTTQQQQTQQQQQPAQTLQRPPNMPLAALQQKILIQKMLQNQPVSGLQYPVPSQHQLDQHSVIGQNSGPNPGTGPCTNPNAGSSYVNSPQQALLNQQLKQHLLLQQQQQQQQMITEVEKITPQDQLNRHLTRPPPDYKDQRRNQVNMPQCHQYSGGSSSVSISSSLCFPNTIPTSSLSPQTSNLLSTAHGTRMTSLSTSPHMGCYGNISCSQQNAYSVTSSGVSPVPQHRNPSQIITGQTNPTASRQATPGQGNNLSAFDSGQGINSQSGKHSLNQGTSSQRPPSVMVTSNSASQSWGSQETGGKQQETRKTVGSPFPIGSPYTNQPLQRTVTNQQFPQRALVPPNQLSTIQIRTPVNQMNQTCLNGQVVGASKSLNTRANQVRAQTMPHLNPPGMGMTPPHPLSSNHFPSGASQTSTRAYQGTDHNSDLAFDFLNQQGDNIGPALNSDPDFIDSLLKTEPGNDDWMKDINLDEILGGHS